MASSQLSANCVATRPRVEILPEITMGLFPPKMISDSPTCKSHSFLDSAQDYMDLIQIDSQGGKAQSPWSSTASSHSRCQVG